MKNIIRIIAYLLAVHCGLAAQSPLAPEIFKKLTFFEFFDEQLAPIKLSLEIPDIYVHAEGLDVPSSYSYWMMKQEIAAAKKTTDLPVKTGYIYGKLSLDVGFEREKNKFTNEDDLEDQMKKVEMKLISKKRFEVNGYPVLSFIGQNEKGNVMCAMYVGMLIETNAVVIAYVPPDNNLKIGQVVWNKIVASLKEAKIPKD